MPVCAIPLKLSMYPFVQPAIPVLNERDHSSERTMKAMATVGVHPLLISAGNCDHLCLFWVFAVPQDWLSAFASVQFLQDVEKSSSRQSGFDVIDRSIRPLSEEYQQKVEECRTLGSRALALARACPRPEESTSLDRTGLSTVARLWSFFGDTMYLPLDGNDFLADLGSGIFTQYMTLQYNVKRTITRHYNIYQDLGIVYSSTSCWDTFALPLESITRRVCTKCRWPCIAKWRPKRNSQPLHVFAKPTFMRQI